MNRTDLTSQMIHKEYIQYKHTRLKQTQGEIYTNIKHLTNTLNKHNYKAKQRGIFVPLRSNISKLSSVLLCVSELFLSTKTMVSIGK